MKQESTLASKNVEGVEFHTLDMLQLERQNERLKEALVKCVFYYSLVS